jgi:hypothetical protein
MKQVMGLLGLVLMTMGYSTAADAQEICRTYSRGYTFESRDPWYGRQIVVDQCVAHPSTNNDDCRQNVRCDGQFNPGPGPGPGPGNGNGQAFIRGVNDRGYLNGSHFIELYGDFPQQGWNNNYQSEVRCEGWNVSSRIDYFSRTQINVAYSLPRDRSSCTVRVFDRFNGSSNTYGPMILRNYPR